MKRKDKLDGSNNKNMADSYNQFKEFEGKRYTGMKIGRSHSWLYDAGQWKETKMTPDKWEIHYAVTKRRKGKAPEGSGVPVGTKYHWYILAHQVVEKLNANDYSTELSGMKFKLAHQRANKDEWNISDVAQKRRLAKLLQELATNLEEEIEASKPKKAKRKVSTPTVKQKPLAHSEKIKPIHHKIPAKNEPSYRAKKTGLPLCSKS